MTDHLFAAADLGATSGRVILGRLSAGRFEWSEVHRFPTPSLRVAGHLHWDAPALRDHIATGLRRAGQAGQLAGVGVDTWGVDYARVDRAGQLLEAPYHYRDQRTSAVPDRFFADFPAERLYAQAGLQVMELNTIFQLVASAGDPGWDQVARLLLLPDLFTYFLCGAQVAELTIASTTGLLDVAARDWSATTVAHLRRRYGLDLARVLPDIVAPGTVVGELDSSLLPGGAPVVAVGAHDTASAVAAIPAAHPDFAYISSGTWSLVGLELDRPILTEASRRANFTNELGLDHTVRYLRNVMGLWVLTESQRHWAEQGLPADLAGLLRAAEALPGLTTVVNMEDPRLLAPGDLPSRLAAMAAETGQPVPTTPAEHTRCILDSLALDYRRVIRQAQQLAGVAVEVVHVVGGGCRNRLLNQLTAEATALGNLAAQARAVGALAGTLMDLRQVVRASSQLDTYRPGVRARAADDWDAAERRLFPD
jgi:rhamnulokinase